MTHVFIAPHPDDVALSCGGLIASLRELGQNVAILTLYSGTGGGTSDGPGQREALGFGSKTIWPVTEAFNRAHLIADYPEDSSAAPWQATKEGLEATQGDADAAAKRFWQRSSWYRRANIHNESLAGQPAHRRRVGAGRGPHERAASTPPRRATSWPSAGSRTSATRRSPRCR